MPEDNSQQRVATPERGNRILFYEIKEALTRGVAAITEASVLIVVVTLAILAISAREMITSLLTSQTNDLKSQFIDLDVGGATVVSATKEPKAAPRRRDEKMELRMAIRDNENFKRRIQELIAMGAETDRDVLRTIQKQIHGYENIDSVSSASFWKHVSIYGLDTTRMSSDHLLALAVMTCGAIGAIVAGMRQKAAMTLRHLSLGLSAGFIVYLAIKGGKYVFLLQASGDLVAFNPYGSAFAGLLAGLFTERAHTFLSGFVDQLVERVEAALKGKSG